MSVYTRVIAALRSDAVSGMLLMCAAAVALLWANSPLSESYQALRSVSFGPAAWHLHLPLHEWAADGLLAVFFFIVGNELKHEFVAGELRRPRHAAIPIFAAIGGAIAPAVIFGFINLPDPDAAAGWGIPMATDIAFAIAILAVVGRHLPTALRSFLLTLAIIDDLCVVVVIAVHYSAGVSGLALAGAIAGLGCFGWLQHGKGRYARWIRYLVPQWLLNGPLALIIWALTHASGVHATIAAVAMGLLMRTTVRPGESASPSHRADRALRPVSSGIVLPIFALTSAGIGLRGGSEVFGSPIVWGILLGLVVGKPLGIFATAWLTSRVTRTPLGGGVRWIDIACIGVLAGVGFTVALLVAELSYADSQWLLDAKAAILFGSAAAAVPAAILLGSRSRHYRRHGPRPSATPTDTPGIADGDDGSSAVR